jgi:hypothetical protein
LTKASILRDCIFILLILTPERSVAFEAYYDSLYL